MGNGWIKLHRKVLENPIYKRSNYFALWIHLLLKANHKQEKFMWNGGVIVVKEGQMVTGRKTLSSETGIPESTIEDILKYLETQHQIQQQKTTKYRLITIVNWKEYQENDSKSDNKATTKQQQADTNKNEKNYKNEKKILATQSAAEDISFVIDLFKEVNPNYERLFGSPPQRLAVDRLLLKNGKEKLVSMVMFLPKSNASRFAPTITTPVQFEQKLGELLAWAQKQKDVKKAKII